MSRTRRLAPALTGLCAVLSLAVAGCGGEDDTGAEGTSTVAAFYPLGFVAERIGGDTVQVDLLTQPGGEPHDLELSPQQIVQVGEADVVLLTEGFQPAVDDAVEQEAAGTVVDAAAVVDLLAVSDDEHADDEHADEHADDEHDEHGDLDPHFWQDPMRMATLAEAVGETYAEADPGNAGAYRAETEALVAELERLDADYRETLAGCRTSTVVTSHDAFGYLAHAYDLELVPIAGIDPGNEPTPERIAELTEVVGEENVTTVFTETLVSPAVAQTVADETGVQVATLDPIEGLTDETADEDYLSLMRANLDALVEANGC